MKTKARKFLLESQDIREQVLLPSNCSSSYRSCWCDTRFEERFRNRDGIRECLRIRDVGKWGKSISSVTFKGGTIVVIERGKTFRAFRRSAKSRISIAAEGLSMRRRYRILIDDTIEIRTGQEKGFFLLNPAIEFTLTNGDAMLRGALGSSESSETGVFQKLHSNQFEKVDLREPDIIRAHFGCDETCATATALLIWVIRGSFASG